MGSAASISTTMACVRAPEELWGISVNVADQWTPVWVSRPQVIFYEQHGDAYQRFDTEGWKYHDPNGGYLPGQVHQDFKLLGTPSPES
jgi:hypothetical protein